MIDYKLSLMTGIDIPIEECSLILHQPTIREIAFLGEKEFFSGIQCLCVKKSMITQDETVLSQTSNFQIFMTIMSEKEAADKKRNVMDVLKLIFPQYQIILMPRALVFNHEQFTISIDESNFEILQSVLTKVFCLDKGSDENYNPGSKKAQEIAKKLMAGRKKVAELNGTADQSVFTQYLSILTIGLNSMSLQDLIELTMFQLFDLVERYMLYVNWDIDVRSRLAGGKPDSKPDNWMKILH